MYPVAMILEGSNPNECKIYPHWRPSEKTILNRITGLPYLITRSEEVIVTPAQINSLRSLCNEPAIYDIFFRDKFSGAPFSDKNATELLEMASQGWRKQSNFHFTLLDPQGLVIGIVRIKSPNRAMAEIGYWCSGNHRGVMTEAVRAVSELAEEADFFALCAKVRKDNYASIKVLHKNNFLCTGDWQGDPARFRFQVQLNPLNLANFRFNDH